ncbi:MAG: hypothetical protein KGZ82_05710 [Bacteroidales bacterium]|nr:hypothetical protein [Bacteroidales bacterium]MBS4056793.1 hypothetical protein [Bacteroidales bacterium]
MKHPVDFQTIDFFGKRGRIATGNAKSNAERQAAYRARKRAQGLKPRVTWQDANASCETRNENASVNDAALGQLSLLQTELEALRETLQQEKTRNEYLLSEIKAERKRVAGLKGQIAKLKQS